jgi:hypothetical protein
MTKKPLYDRAIFTEPYGDGKPISYRGYQVPEYFSAHFYFFDNDGRVVNESNGKNFKTWTLELLVRVTKAETLEIVQSSILGASAYRGHIVASTQGFNPDNYDAVKAHYQNQVSENRPHLLSHAITRALQNHEYSKTKAGGHSWTLYGGRVFSEDELRVLAKQATNESYTRLTYSFYQEVARLYKEAVEQGENPIQTLIAQLDKSEKRVQAYATKCRRLGLLGKTTPGKVSTVRKSPNRKKG